MNTQAYFDRIGFEGSAKADLQTLQQLLQTASYGNLL